MALGPWTLETDVEDQRLLEALEAVAASVPAVYGERFGRPVPDGGRVLLFRHEQDFRNLLAWELPEGDSGVQGHARDGTAALYVGDRPQAAVRATLVHELTHLLNRHAFGASLPAWLDEGMAEDLAYSRVDRRGALLPGSLQVEVSARERSVGGLETRRQERTLEVTIQGPAAGLSALLGAWRRGAAPSLAELLDVERELFSLATGREQRYAAAGFFVRFLLDEGGGRSGGRRRQAFQRFLSSVATGGSGDFAALEQALGEPLGDLERAFYSWLRVQEATGSRP